MDGDPVLAIGCLLPPCFPRLRGRSLDRFGVAKARAMCYGVEGFSF